MCYIIIGILSVALLLLFFILWIFVRQIQDICRQLSFLMEKDSNIRITSQLDYGGMGKLVDILKKIERNI